MNGVAAVGLGPKVRPLKQSDISASGDTMDALHEILSPQFFQTTKEPTISYSTDYGLVDIRLTLEGSEVLPDHDSRTAACSFETSMSLHPRYPSHSQTVKWTSGGRALVLRAAWQRKHVCGCSGARAKSGPAMLESS